MGITGENMKKLINKLLTGLIISGVAILGYKFITSPSGPKVYESTVLSDAMITLSESVPTDSLVIMDARSFMPDIRNAFGLFPNDYIKNQLNQVKSASKKVNILVDSGGGSVDKMYEILTYTKSFQNHGYDIICYVAKAMSAAFTFVLTGCDKVVLLEGGQMMQHKAYYANQDYSVKVLTANTELTSIAMAKLEYKRVKGLSFREYYALTRDGSGDTYLSESELLKYGIVDEVME